jgi:hypothetical protein
MVRSHIEQGGEWLLSLETLCDMLTENKNPIPRKVYELLEEAADLIRMQDRRRLHVSIQQVANLCEQI